MRIIPASTEAAEIAAHLLREGKLVVVPTETVYGLAARALNEEAIARVFEAKGRPSDNPLIVHIGGLADLGDIARAIPEAAHKLARAFWPGPLTFVLPKTDLIPAIVTAGLDTVAVRAPNHPVALELAKLAGPFAAPSANRFMSVSPTRVEHLDAELLEHVDLVIDGGPCEVGVESTVLDLTDKPRILRPGGVSREQVEAILGEPVSFGSPESVRRSPGMHRRHYAPRTPLRLVDRIDSNAGGLTMSSPQNELQIQMAREPRAYAASLYDALHRLDRFALKEAQVELPPQSPEWASVLDRLTRAATPPGDG